MWRDSFLFGSRGVRFDDIAEWLIGGRTPEAACAPLAQIILDTSLNGLAQYDPRLPHRPRHHAYAVKLLVGILRAVASPHCHGQPRNVAAQLQTAFAHCISDNVAKKRIA